MTQLAAALRSPTSGRRTRRGPWLTFLTPYGLELSASARIDWLGVDLQHGDLRLDDLAGLLRATSVPVLARVASHSAEMIGRVIDTGVDGVIVPAVADAEEARSLVAAAYLPPRGRRSTGLARAAITGATEQPLLLPMVETDQGLRNAADIVQVDGIDGLFAGPYDLAKSLACQIDDPALLRAAEEVISVAATRGKVCGVFAGRDALRHALPPVDLLAVDTDAAALKLGLDRLFPDPQD